MQNDAGQVVDLYVPRKCASPNKARIGSDSAAGAATNRLITAKDHASVQINVLEVDETGKGIPGSFVTYPLCGFIRSRGESDDSLNRLATRDGRALA